MRILAREGKDQMAKKKRGTQDATLINNRATAKRFAKLEARVKKLEKLAHSALRYAE